MTTNPHIIKLMFINITVTHL